MDGQQTNWDARYGEDGLLWGSQPNRMVVELCADLPAGRAVDLGCGEGRNAVWLATVGHDVTGIDVSRVGIDKARDLAERAGVAVTWVVGDLMTLTLEASAFDLVLLCYLQLPEEARRTVHAGAISALAPGGRVVLVAHHADNLEHGVGGPPYPEVLFDEKQLREDFAPLDIERCERVERSVTDRGTALDIVLVARRD